MTRTSPLAATSILLLLILSGWNAPSNADDAGSPDPDALFKQLDVNGDGKLTASEIPPAHRKFFERLLRVANAEKSGELTREQFDRALSQKEDSVGNINNMGGLGMGGPSPNPKQIFRALDKNKDGKLTRDEVKGRPRIEALFDRLGKDELTLEDLESALKQGKPGGNAKKLKRLATINPGIGSEMPERSQPRGEALLFRLLDTNHDGKISREEFSKAGEIFDQLDRNQDGFLDATELMGSPPAHDAEEMERPASGSQRPPGRGLGTAVRPGKRQLIEQIVDKIMNADADGNGKLSMAEAPHFLRRHFARVDANGDGFIDREELEAFLKTHKKFIAALGGQPPPQKMPGF